MPGTIHSFRQQHIRNTLPPLHPGQPRAAEVFKRSLTRNTKEEAVKKNVTSKLLLIVSTIEEAVEMALKNHILTTLQLPEHKNYDKAWGTDIRYVITTALKAINLSTCRNANNILASIKNTYEKSLQKKDITDDELKTETALRILLENRKNPTLRLILEQVKATYNPSKEATPNPHMEAHSKEEFQANQGKNTPSQTPF